MVIYLIRHGRQNSSDCNVNVPLSKAGKRQAKLLGDRLQKYKIDALYSSDLIRAYETASIAFSSRKDILDKINIRTGLAEINFGDLTGVKNPVVKKFYSDYYEKQINEFNKRGFNVSEEENKYVGDYFIPPDEMWYPNGENGAMVLDRLMPVVNEWIDSPYENVAVVCHGGVIRVLLCALFGGDFKRRLMFGTSLENCSITKIHYDEKLKGFYLDSFNDFAHLEKYPDLMRCNFVKS